MGLLLEPAPEGAVADTVTPAEIAGALRRRASTAANALEEGPEHPNAEVIALQIGLDFAAAAALDALEVAVQQLTGEITRRARLEQHLREQLRDMGIAATGDPDFGR
jgi:hypothetical protein